MSAARRFVRGFEDRLQRGVELGPGRRSGDGAGKHWRGDRWLGRRWSRVDSCTL